jgi:hypothetical protein
MASPPRGAAGEAGEAAAEHQPETELDVLSALHMLRENLARLREHVPGEGACAAVLAKCQSSLELALGAAPRQIEALRTLEGLQRLRAVLTRKQPHTLEVRRDIIAVDEEINRLRVLLKGESSSPVVMAAPHPLQARSLRSPSLSPIGNLSIDEDETLADLSTEAHLASPHAAEAAAAPLSRVLQRVLAPTGARSLLAAAPAAAASFASASATLAPPPRRAPPNHMDLDNSLRLARRAQPEPPPQLKPLQLAAAPAAAAPAGSAATQSGAENAAPNSS